MKRTLIATATAVIAALALASLPGTAMAIGTTVCQPTGFFRDSMNLTAVQIGGNVTGTLDASGNATVDGIPCDIGVYYGPSTTGLVSGTVENARYFGVVNNGGTVTVKNATVRQIGDVPFTGAQHGNAIFFAGDSPNSTGAIRSTTVTDYQKGGIVLTGASTSATIAGNTVVGEGPVSYIAQNGIQVSRGAKAAVTGNAVSNNAYTGDGSTSSSGILVFGGAGFGVPNTSGIKITQNTVTNNDVGVWLFNAGDCTTTCTASTTATSNTVKFNTISNEAVTNTTGYSGGLFGTPPDCGYQAGVADLGKKDAIVNNSISGFGYTPQSPDCGGVPIPAFLRFVDVSTKAHGVPSNK
jgi:hypothetical protein